MTTRSLHLLVALPLAALALTACSDTSDTKAGASADDEVSIVASTNVYGDIARQIAGDRATVTSFVNSSTQDPHEYEASAQDRLAVDDADIVIENGGGYDHFVDVLLSDADSDPTILTAVAISGLVPADKARDEEAVEGFNEHVWYKFDVVDALAKDLSEKLSKLDPDNASTYEANYASFAKQISGLEKSASDLKATASGQGVAITEPVPLYLLNAAGLVNKTPGEFSEAVEEGGDVPPRALADTLNLFKDGGVVLLAYNDQTSDATTEQVRAAAEAASIPVVDFTETLPKGQSYVEWQQANLDNLAAALG